MPKARDRRVSSRDARVYAAVSRIPRGRVATYGQIATLVGLHGHARQVGYALHALPDGSAVPWHRVVNARGEISRRADGGSDHAQKVLLELEGVTFDPYGRIDLDRFRWKPRSRAARRR